MKPLARPKASSRSAAVLVTALACVALGVGPAAAIGTITDGGVTFGYTNDFSSSNRNTVDTTFTGAATGNQAYESWWFFRVAGDGRETAFGTPDIELYNGSIGRLDWNDPSGSGLFEAMLQLEVLDDGSTGGNLFQNLTVSNTAAAALVIDIFHYTDLDVGGNFTGDSAVLTSGSGDISMTVTDGADSSPIMGYGADAFQVARQSLLLLDLNDRNVDDLDGSGLPFGSNDFTVGFQWSLTVGVGESASFLTQFASNAPLLPETATAIPEPGTAILLLGGLLALGRRRD